MNIACLACIFLEYVQAGTTKCLEKLEHQIFSPITVIRQSLVL